MTDMTNKPPINEELAAHNRRIAEAEVPAAAAAECIRLIRAGQFGDFPRSADCTPAFRVAKRHGGDAVVAQALQFRFIALEMLLRAAPFLTPVVAKLPAHVLGGILSAYRLTADGAAIGFDGDALEKAIRAASQPVGQA
jgi:hypothetical protein